MQPSRNLVKTMAWNPAIIVVILYNSAILCNFAAVNETEKPIYAHI